MRADGEGVTDGLFEINKKNIGVCVFYSYKGYEEDFVKSIDIDKFLNNLAEEISQNTFNRLFIGNAEELSKIIKEYAANI